MKTNSPERFDVRLVYSATDADFAESVALRMQERRVDATIGHLVVDEEPGLSESLSRTTPPRSYLILFVSDALRRTNWVERQLNDQDLQELFDRGITIFLVAI